MDNLFLYLLKVSVATMLFYLSYILFLNKDTFYRRNRFFLAGILLLSFTLPVMRLSAVFGSRQATGLVKPVYNIFVSGASIESAVANRMLSTDLNSILLWIYISISALLLLRLLASVVRTFMIIRKGRLIERSFPMVVISDLDHPPFSFFPYVVIPVKTHESGDYSEVIAHEKAHVKQGHTFDLIFTELLIAVLWFNPFIWLIKRAMVLNHEYLADNSLVKSSFNMKNYQYKLLNITQGLTIVTSAHNFSSLIKNRIIMLNKKPTSNYAALKSIIILPVAAILFMMFSFRPGSGQISNGYQGNLFSKSSESEILTFLAMNTGYPEQAKNNSDTGSVFVVIKMAKGGIVKDCKAFTDVKEVKAPLLNEIVIVGYKPAAAMKYAADVKTAGTEHAALKSEALRVANKLSEVKVPEWNDKDMEFAIPVKFELK